MTTAGPAPRGAIPFIGGFESTFQPTFDVDVLETTGHTLRWREDIELLRACGVRQCRYPVRWHRVEREPGDFDWAETDIVLGYMRDTGVAPIVDLVHHTSYPLWLGDFANPGFGAAFLRYVEAFAARYSWIDGYTLFNEPFTTFLLCGQEGAWPPYLRGLEGFVALARNILPAIAEASRRLRELLPDACHLYVEACERASGEGAEGEEYAAYANDRRFLLTDAFVGRPIDRDRPAAVALAAAGGADLLELEPGHVDVLGLDYYAHNQWHWFGPGHGTTSSPVPARFGDLIREYWERYRLPVVIGETNIRGFPSDRASWLRYTLEQAEDARAGGVPVEGYCWFPFVDSCDWDSLLSRSDSSVDPVGVYWLDADLDRRASSMSAAYAAAARGTPAAELPAYAFEAPVSRWLSGWMPQMAHWSWQPAPAEELTWIDHDDDYDVELKVAEHGP